ncbi:MAG: nitroreductase family protein [Actinomycetota bacterium]|nr:nitroreductase family protein [Actinomycetota bacterium]
MEFREVVRRRRMVRRYTDDRVDPAVVDRILEHATHAPSAGFSQGWAFLVLDEPEDVRRFWAVTTPAPTAGADAGSSNATDSAWLAGMRAAPVVIVPLACKDAYLDRYAEPDKGWTDRDEARWPVPYWYVDTGMASLLMLLTAVDEHLAACFFGIPPERVEAFRAAFGVPADHTPVGAVTVGHPAPDRRSPSLRRGRRGLHEVVHRGRW